MELNRFAPLQLNGQLTLKNRVVVPPMASGTADAKGRISDQTIKHYQRLAESGAGLVFVEYTFVSDHGRSEPQQLGLSSDSHTDRLAELAETIKRRGAKAGIQLTHCGGKSHPSLTGGVMWGPSQGKVPAKDRELMVMAEMSLQQIESLIHDFLLASRRAAAAGFDIIELHCAHGYGINQWLSPLTNHRLDRYGGGREGRFQILQEIITAIREEIPQVLLATRLPGQDHFPGGLDSHDTAWIVKELEGLGVGLIDVSSGIGGWRRPKHRRGQGYLVPDAQQIKMQINLPVIGVGGIVEGEYIDKALQMDWFDLGAVGRAILENPLQWAERNLRRTASP